MKDSVRNTEGDPGKIRGIKWPKPCDNNKDESNRRMYKYCKKMIPYSRKAIPYGFWYQGEMN